MRTLAILASLLLGSLTSFTNLSAQEVIKEPLPQRGALLDGKTIVKTSLVGDLLGSYNLSAERILNKRFGVELGLGISPLSDATYTAYNLSSLALIKLSDYNREAKGHSLSLAGRYYVSKTGYGHGFYFQAAYNYGSMSSHGSDKMTLKSGNIANINRTDRMSYHNIGVGIGAQWLIGKKRNIVLDWNIINLNRNIGYKDENTYTLRSQQPFTLEDSSEVLTSIYANEVGLFGMLLTWPFFGSVTPSEPFKEGQSMTFSRNLSSKLHVSTNLSIGFRF